MTMMTRHYKFTKCVMISRSYRFYCWLIFCCCPILLVHTDTYNDRRDHRTDETTVRDFLYTSTIIAKAIAGNNLTSNRFDRSSARDIIDKLKDHIKRVLNLEPHNDTIDEYIAESFNIRNPDPVYVFALPDDSNRTLIFRKSNFSDATFPNVTALQTLRKFIKHSKLFQYPNFDRKANDDAQFFAKYQQFKFNIDDLDETESLKIVEENVRTERNFFKFMDTLHDKNSMDDTRVRNIDEGFSGKTARVGRLTTDYQSVLKNIHTKDHIGNYKLTYGHSKKPAKMEANGKVTWDDLGLHGWSGSIDSTHENPEENENPIPVQLMNAAIKNPNMFGNKFIPILSNFDPLSFLTTSTSIPQPSAVSLFQSQANDDQPLSFHHYSFVTHNKPFKFQMPSRPKPPPVILSSIVSSTSHPIQLFSPAPSYLPPYRKPNTVKYDTWDVKWNISTELRDLLKLEREKLQSISHALHSKPNKKWPITSSRSAHRDKDVFVGRANNPFGHSTKWKWSNSSNDVSEDDGRQKRGVVELYSMVKCATGCDPLIYKGYGCYCGFLGRGRALDGIDRCCKMHDYCYEVASCPKFLEYFVPYLWKCYRGRPLCAIDHGEWGGPGSCASMLCECDKVLSKCLRRYYCPRKRAVCSSSPLRLLQNIIMDL